jgi:hypothetical protein
MHHGLRILAGLLYHRDEELLHEVYVYISQPLPCFLFSRKKGEGRVNIDTVQLSRMDYLKI